MKVLNHLQHYTLPTGSLLSCAFASYTRYAGAFAVGMGLVCLIIIRSPAPPVMFLQSGLWLFRRNSTKSKLKSVNRMSSGRSRISRLRLFRFRKFEIYTQTAANTNDVRQMAARSSGLLQIPWRRRRRSDSRRTRLLRSRRCRKAAGRQIREAESWSGGRGTPGGQCGSRPTRTGSPDRRLRPGRVRDRTRIVRAPAGPRSGKRRLHEDRKRKRKQRQVWRSRMGSGSKTVFCWNRAWQKQLRFVKLRVFILFKFECLNWWNWLLYRRLNPLEMRAVCFQHI